VCRRHYLNLRCPVVGREWLIAFASKGAQKDCLLQEKSACLLNVTIATIRYFLAIGVTGLAVAEFAKNSARLKSGDFSYL
jgi:hypothetical protein